MGEGRGFEMKTNEPGPPDPAQLELARRLVRASSRPVLYAGGGVGIEMLSVSCPDAVIRTPCTGTSVITT